MGAGGGGGARKQRHEHKNDQGYMIIQCGTIMPTKCELCRPTQRRDVVYNNGYVRASALISNHILPSGDLIICCRYLIGDRLYVVLVVLYSTAARMPECRCK